MTKLHEPYVVDVGYKSVYYPDNDNRIRTITGRHSNSSGMGLGIRDHQFEYNTEAQAESVMEAILKARLPGLEYCNMQREDAFPYEMECILDDTNFIERKTEFLSLETIRDRFEGMGQHIAEQTGLFREDIDQEHVKVVLLQAFSFLMTE